MRNDDYFHESVPDGISNAIFEYDPAIECSNQDAYELLVRTFGRELSGDDLRNANDATAERFALHMQELFELESAPTAGDARTILSKALRQWEG